MIAIDSENDAISLADALIRGGLPVAEITFRTTAAAAVICKIRKERPDVIVGAGTILTIENLKAAIDSSAQFGVAPGLNPDIVAEAKKLSFPFIPGIITPSEIEKALSLGCKFLKFFPAGDAGGPKMLKSLCGPYAHTGVKFMPTGIGEIQYTFNFSSPLVQIIFSVSYLVLNVSSRRRGLYRAKIKSLLVRQCVHYW